MPPAAFAKALDSKTGLISLVAVGAVIVIGVLFLLRRGLGDLFGGVSDTVGSIGDVLGDLAGGAADLSGGVKDVAGGSGEVLSAGGSMLGDFGSVAKDNNVFALAAQINSATKRSVSDVQATKTAGLVALKLTKISHENDNIWRAKRNKARVRVTANGRPVEGVSVNGYWIGTLGRTGNYAEPIESQTDAQGYATLSWSIMNLPGKSEDDIEVIASAAGFNPSNVLLFK